MDGPARHTAPGGGISKTISALTSNYPAAGMGLAGIVFLWLIGMTRTAVAFGIAGAIIVAVAFGGDQTLCAIVDPSRPLEPTSASSFPSGHVFGSTVFFGFGLFLLFYNRTKTKILVPVAILFISMIFAVGFARMYDHAHWPSDVAGAYLLGAIWLLLLIPAFIYFQRMCRGARRPNRPRRWTSTIVRAAGSRGLSQAP